MGWGRGTEIFDQVADDLIDISYEYTGDGYFPSIIEPVLKNLYQVLSDLDWDTECESKYYDHYYIGKILGNKFDEE